MQPWTRPTLHYKVSNCNSHEAVIYMVQ